MTAGLQCGPPFESARKARSSGWRFKADNRFPPFVLIRGDD